MDDVDEKNEIIFESKRARVATVKVDESIKNGPQELQECAFEHILNSGIKIKW